MAVGAGPRPPFSAPSAAERPLWRLTLEVLGAGLIASDPRAAVRSHLHLDSERLVLDETRDADELALDLRRFERVFVVGVGKAAFPMMAAVEEVLAERLTEALAVVPHGAVAAGSVATVYEAGHPLPDPGSLLAGRRLARLLDDAGEADLVILALSGGASALIELPSGRIPLVDIRAATGLLLGAGARIDEVNAVRKHLSSLKGGGMARMAAPATVACLVLSDVVGGPLDVIGSGPTAADPTTFADALGVLDRLGLTDRVPESVTAHLIAGAAGHWPETCKEGDEALRRVTTRIVGDNSVAVTAAAVRARALGLHATVLTSSMEGEAREVGLLLAGVAKEIADRGRPLSAPACVVVGGETTVTVRRLGGSGGRNQELALSAALAIDGRPTVALGALATDGIDGVSSAAGAIVDGSTVSRAAAAGLDARRALEANDSGTFFEALGDRIVTGPTSTNVNDLVAILVATPDMVDVGAGASVDVGGGASVDVGGGASVDVGGTAGARRGEAPCTSR